jgi:amino acid transporter
MNGQAPAASASLAASAGGNRFGTFGGVFTPAILTIFGVIMFMRAGFVVGQAGVLHALLVLCIANSITLLTGLSLSAISTNTAVRGGGAYFLISRVLGPECGGAIGTALYMAQTLSVPFYVLGFAEALTRTFPGLAPHYAAISLSTAAALLALAYLGAGWAVRVQYLILGVLGLSIATFASGLAVRFDPSRLAENLGPGYSGPENTFWVLFAIYFPAVTGIMAGVNMSGDLKDPARSLPRGTLAAILVSFGVYAVQLVLFGAAGNRGELCGRSYEFLLESAPFRAAFLVVAGVFAATLSSALGSIVGAPRVLQAMARDDVLPMLGPLAAGSRRRDEPRRALLVTAAITGAVLWYAGNGQEGRALDMVARVITMFFLLTYGMINLSAFVESFGRNPSFRPRFRLFHWTTALAGALACGITAFLIDPAAAAMATVLVAATLYLISRRRLQAAFGDARRGFLFSRVRDNLVRLAALPAHAKNWRPTILVLSGNPGNRLSLVRYGAWLECGRGILTLADIVECAREDMARVRREGLERLERFIRESGMTAFAEVAAVTDFEEGLRVLLQAHSLGPIKPNVVLLGWPGGSGRMAQYVRLACAVRELGMSLVVARGNSRLAGGEPAQRRIDIWWRGMENGSLMVILAYLLSRNPEWHGSRLRLLRAVSSPEEAAAARTELQQLAAAARIEAEVLVPVSGSSLRDVLQEHSGDSSAILMGFRPPSEAGAEDFHRRFAALLDGMPTTLLVASSGEADLLA